MERSRKRGPRCSLLSLCLGMGALTVALVARLLAHKPQCPGPLAKQRPSFQMRLGSEPQERSVHLGVEVQVSL